MSQMDEMRQNTSTLTADEDKKQFWKLLTHFGAENGPFLPKKNSIFADSEIIKSISILLLLSKML